MTSRNLGHSTGAHWHRYHWFFCIFKNSGKHTHTHTHWPCLLRSVSSTVLSLAAPNLPVSWCYSMVIQPSIKIYLITAFNLWVNLDSHCKSYTSEQTRKIVINVWNDTFERLAGLSAELLLFSCACLLRLNLRAESLTFVYLLCLDNIIKIPSSWLLNSCWRAWATSFQCLENPCCCWI